MFDHKIVNNAVTRSHSKKRRVAQVVPELKCTPSNLFFTFTMLWKCPFQDGVYLVEVSNFYVSKKTRVKPFRRKNSGAFYLTMSA